MEVQKHARCWTGAPAWAGGSFGVIVPILPSHPGLPAGAQSGTGRRGWQGTPVGLGGDQPGAGPGWAAGAGCGGPGTEGGSG